MQESGSGDRGMGHASLGEILLHPGSSVVQRTPSLYRPLWSREDQVSIPVQALIRAFSQILQPQTHIVSLDHETEDQAEGGPGRHGECDSLVATQPRDWQGGRFAATQPQLSWLGWTYWKPSPSCPHAEHPLPLFLTTHPLHFSSLAAIPRVPSGFLGLALRKAGHMRSFSASPQLWLLKVVLTLSTSMFCFVFDKY